MTDKTFTELIKQDFQRLINPETNREEGLHIFKPYASSFKKFMQDKKYNDVSVEKENEIYQKMKELATLYIQTSLDPIIIQFFQAYYDIKRMRKLRQGNTLKKSGGQVSDDDSSVVSYDYDDEVDDDRMSAMSEDEIKELFLKEWRQAVRAKSLTYDIDRYQVMIIPVQVACQTFKDTNESFLDVGFQISACLHRTLSLVYKQDPATNKMFANRVQDIPTKDKQDLNDAFARIHFMADNPKYKTSYTWAAVKTYQSYFFQKALYYIQNKYDNDDSIAKRGHRDFSGKSIEEVKNHLAELKEQFDEGQTTLNYLDIALSLRSVIDAFQQILCLLVVKRNPFTFEDPFFDKLDPLPRFDVFDNPFKIEELVEIAKYKMDHLDINKISFAALRDISKCILTLELDWKKPEITPGPVGEFEEVVVGAAGEEANGLSMKESWEKCLENLTKGYEENQGYLLLAADHYLHILQVIVGYQECEDPFYGFLTEPKGRFKDMTLAGLVKDIIELEIWDFDKLNALFYRTREAYYESQQETPAPDDGYRPMLTDSMFNTYIEQKAREFYNSQEEAMSDLENQVNILANEDPTEIEDEDVALHLTTIWYWMNDCPNQQSMDKQLGLFRNYNLGIANIHSTKQNMIKTAQVIINAKTQQYLADNMWNIAKCFKIIYGTCYWNPKHSPKFTKAHAL